jgi:hypothetical protein
MSTRANFSADVGIKQKRKATVGAKFSLIDQLTDIGNLAEAIDEALDVLNDENATKRSKKQASLYMKKIAQDAQALKSTGPRSIAKISTHKSLLYIYTIE